MTEKFWQQEKERIRINKSNIHPDIQQTFDDNRGIVPNTNFRELYFDCLQADMNLKSIEQSDKVTLEDMAMLVCRDAGCELQYCQAGLWGPNANPFTSCDDQYKKFNQCQEQEKKRYLYDNHEKTMKDHLFNMIEQKKDKFTKANEIEHQQNKQLQTEKVNREKGYITNENENPNRQSVTKDETL
jgi:hypothetical protein